MKICIKCGIEKDESLFYTGRNQCKVCVYELHKKYRLKNPEYGKKYRLKDPERIKNIHKKYRLKSPERYKECRRKAAKKYNLKNPDTQRAINARRRDRKRTLGETILSKSHIEFVRNQFNNVCYVCKATHSTHGDKIVSLALDHHLPLSKGYPLKLGNIVLLCNSCNTSKGTKINEEYYTKEQLADLESKLKEQENFLLLEESNNDIKAHYS